MSVYVELVIFNNLAINALLIVLTLSFRRRKICWWRVLLAAVVGALTSVGYGVAPEGWRIAIRVVLAPVMCLIFDSYNFKNVSKQIKDYILSIAAFGFFTFALGGSVFGLSYLLGVDLNGYISLGICALGACVAILFVRFSVRCAARRMRKVEDICVYANGNSVRVKALCDSGNTLTDTVSGLPVIIASRELELSLMGIRGENNKGELESEGFICVHTIADEKLLPLVKLECVEVGGRVINAYCALSRKSFDGFDAILQCSMF